MKLTAILWDYDGTLIDSRHKNLSVNKEIFAKIKPNLQQESWPIAFSSIEHYQNAVYQSKDWREIYTDHLGLTEAEALAAGGMWTEYHMKNQTEVTLFDGISSVVKSLKNIPQGICSLNSSENIIAILKRNKIDHCFKSVVGFDTISLDKPKPYPDSFLHCLNEMNVSGEGTIFYIGDHQEDIHFARNAGVALQKKNKDVQVLSIAAAYSGVDPSSWNIQPDFIATSAIDISCFIREVALTC
jgi:HAD superfamily hydrolase (TIGR01549 family)